VKLGTKRFQFGLSFNMPDGGCRGLFWLILAAGASLGGCGAKIAPVNFTEIAKPRDALLAFLSAVGQGDAAKAKAFSVGTEQDKKWIDAMVGLIGGLRSYDDAVVARFGRQATSADIDLKQAIFSLANQPIVRFQDGMVKESEDTAEVQAAVGHIRLAAQPPFYLKRDKEGWKVDLSTLRERTQHSPEAIEQTLAAAKVLAENARAVRSGRYKTFDEAQQALGQSAGI
jgi:hypothetical protein